jgi:hypothetical protein
VLALSVWSPLVSAPRLLIYQQVCGNGSGRVAFFPVGGEAATTFTAMETGAGRERDSGSAEKEELYGGFRCIYASYETSRRISGCLHRYRGKRCESHGRVDWTRTFKPRANYFEINKITAVSISAAVKM